LYWTVGLYDASADYPLSKRVTVGDDEYGLVRHAATAIVNAHTGRVLLLADVTVGPIAQTWMREFPSLFATPDRMSAALLAALPPPVDGVRIQADLLARFGLSGDSSWMGHLPWNGGADSVLRDGSALLFAAGRGGIRSSMRCGERSTARRPFRAMRASGSARCVWCRWRMAWRWCSRPTCGRRTCRRRSPAWRCRAIRW